MEWFYLGISCSWDLYSLNLRHSGGQETITEVQRLQSNPWTCEVSPFRDSSGLAKIKGLNSQFQMLQKKYQMLKKQACFLVLSLPHSWTSLNLLSIHLLAWIERDCKLSSPMWSYVTAKLKWCTPTWNLIKLISHCCTRINLGLGPYITPIEAKFCGESIFVNGDAFDMNGWIKLMSTFIYVPHLVMLGRWQTKSKNFGTTQTWIPTK